MKLQDKRVYPQTIDMGPLCGRESHFGMTLLEHYAGLAMQGILASGVTIEHIVSLNSGGYAVGHDLSKVHPAIIEEPVALTAIACAKALIAELEKNSPAGGGE